jgi:hypothetical protein
MEKWEHAHVPTSGGCYNIYCEVNHLPVEELSKNLLHLQNITKRLSVSIYSLFDSFVMFILINGSVMVYIERLSEGCPSSFSLKWSII